MLKQLIALSIRQRSIVLLLTLVLAIAGWRSYQNISIDAIPDLSDVQVIVKTPYPGQSPQLVEQQVTYPLSNLMLSVPAATSVRGYSFFGDSYLYILFEEDTDMYWARSRVLEYLNQASAILPSGVVPTLGPDASGVGWVYQYALRDNSGSYNLADLKSLQDWFLKPELQSVKGVAEIATVGGMTRTYQVEVDPLKLAQYGIDIQQLVQLLRNNNAETGGSVVELAEAEYMLRVKGYLQELDDFSMLPLGKRNEQNVPLLLKDVAKIKLGPQMRRGIAELDGEGEVVGGIVVMRSGENARQVIDRVKQRIAELKTGLPPGVELIAVYDRSGFIQEAVDNLENKLLEEMLLVAGVLFVFLWHLRSTLVAVIILPLSLALSFLLMQLFSINANIMSLGGIAIAIGALVDAAVVMLENVHKHKLQYYQQHGKQAEGRAHWSLVQRACEQVGPALFLSLLLITVSFFPIFALEGQEGKLFTPLAFTKSFAMAAAALLAVTLLPVLMGYLVKGKVIDEEQHLLSNWLARGYKPLIHFSLEFPWLVLLLFTSVAVSAYFPYKEQGSEFMPQIDEGDLLYMPTTLPGVSIGKAAQLLQQTNALIKQIPEVESVFGKIGRAETATDPAPLTMIESNVQLKPKSEWREGLTLEQLKDELQQQIQFPGVTNAWVQPIKTRIDMLSTGIKTPLGLKIAGEDLQVIEQIGQQVEGLLSALAETRSVYSERAASGRYIEITPDLVALASYGLDVQHIQQLIQYAVGGKAVTQVVTGNQRYPVNLRFNQEYRDSLQALKDLPVSDQNGLFIPLSRVARVEFKQGPAMIKSENARTIAWTFIDVQQVSVGEYLQKAKALLDEELELPPRYSLTWSGQYESIQRVEQSLLQIVPLTLLLILLLLFITLKSWFLSLAVVLVIPLGLTGSAWALWYWQFDYSIAVVVGMIAMAGVAAEFGVIMLLYLQQAWEEVTQKSQHTLRQAVIHGAVKRIRPKAMTVLTIVIGLLPVMYGQQAGYEVMQRIALPMLGGMVLAPLASLFVLPVLFYLWHKRGLSQIDDLP